MLRGAAKVPSTDADVAGAWRRGRRMRVQRRVVSGVAIVAVIALGSIGVANLLSSGHDTTPAAPVTTVPPAVCDAPSTATAVPSWAESANPPRGVGRLLSPDGNVLAVVFANPLRVGAPTDPANKILWVVRQPREGQPLEITATLPGSTEKPVHLSFPANSGPGEIYPSGDNVLAPGCWHFELAWNGHHSALNLAYKPAKRGQPTAVTTTTTPAKSSSSPTTASTTASPTPCHTANLGITLGGPIGSAGHFNYELRFRNNGASACVMSGFPGVSFLDSSGHQIGAAAGRNSLPHAPITLAPGATAYAHLSVTDPSVLNGCAATPVAKLRVFPPNETTQALVGGGGIAVCAQSTPSTEIDAVLDHSAG
jgi:hypothetical protein